jgi:hypothetical protein
MESRSTRPRPEGLRRQLYSGHSSAANVTRPVGFWKSRFIISARKPAALTHIYRWFSLPLHTNARILVQIKSRPLLPIPYSSLRTIFSIHLYTIWRTGSFVTMWRDNRVEMWPSSAYTDNCVWVKDICSTRLTIYFVPTNAVLSV